MNTQDPTLRAAACLKGATKPVRIYLGAGRIGHASAIRGLVAQTQLEGIARTQPWRVIELAHDTPIDEAARAITTAWDALRPLIAKAPNPTFIPSREHPLRGANFRRRTA